MSALSVYRRQHQLKFIRRHESNRRLKAIDCCYKNWVRTGNKMTILEILTKLLSNDHRATEILTEVSNYDKFAKEPLLHTEAPESYVTAWEIFIPQMLADETNPEWCIAKSIKSDLINIAYEGA